MDKKKIIVFLVIAVIAYFLLKGNNAKNVEPMYVEQPDSEEERVAKAIENVSQNYNATAQESVASKVMSVEDEEYNLARDKYRSLYGEYPKSSWSLSQIEQGIKEKVKIDALVEEYISKGGSQATLDADEDILTLPEIQNHLNQLNNNYDIVVEKAETELGVTIDRNKYNTIAKVENFVSNKLVLMKQEWENIKNSLSGRSSEFQTHLNSQAKVSFFNKIKDDCIWYCALSLREQWAVGELVGWNLLLGGKLGWMKDDTRYTWEQRNAFAAANSKALSASKLKIDQYGRFI
jgi:hypothetical protein